MEDHDPNDLIPEVEQQREQETTHAREALQWFLADERVGTLLPRLEVVRELATHLDVSQDVANRVVASLVGDIVDPVQQVIKGTEKYVGVIEYAVHEAEGAYSYVDYDDRLGRRKRVVCARCVEQHDLDERIKHATQGEGTSAPDADWSDLLNKITAHYANHHEQGPETIEPGASLVDGTTISGNTAFHAGNDGTGSGLDADTLQGSGPAAYNVAKDVSRNANGEVNFQYAGQASTTTNTTASPLTTQISATGRVVHDKLSVNLPSGAGVAKVKRNGATLESSNSSAAVTGTPNAVSPTWTAEADFSAITKVQATHSSSISLTSGSPRSSNTQTRNFGQVTATGSQVTFRHTKDPDGDWDGVATLSVRTTTNNKLIGRTTGTRNQMYPITLKTTGNFTNPSFRGILHFDSSTGFETWGMYGRPTRAVATFYGKLSISAQQNETLEVN